MKEQMIKLCHKSLIGYKINSNHLNIDIFHALGVISKNNPPHDSFEHGAMAEVVSAIAAQLKTMATT
jgi:hypothetical protein